MRSAFESSYGAAELPWRPRARLKPYSGIPPRRISRSAAAARALRDGRGATGARGAAGHLRVREEARAVRGDGDGAAELRARGDARRGGRLGLELDGEHERHALATRELRRGAGRGVRMCVCRGPIVSVGHA